MNESVGSATDCEVLVVGAGPTGLVLACELLSQGIDARVIDKNDGAVLETRALGVHARTLEMLDGMGLVERFLDHGQRVRRFRWYSDGRPIATFDLSRAGSRYGFMLDIPQDQTEGLLKVRVVELGGGVEQSVELTGLSQNADCVTATLKDAGGSHRMMTADYLVGCDGCHSRVRHELGLAFEGHPYAQDWLLADVLVDWSRDEDSVQALFNSGMAPLIGFPMRDHRWRLTVPFAGQRRSGLPTLEEFQDFVNQRAPERPRLSDPTWLSSFRVHRRSTDTYRQGRVMLAGDAVHVHSPAGGQGMNTGMMDAHNLGWKLALVARGQAPEMLLDTYGEERGPIASKVLSLTHTLVVVGTLESGFKRVLRDALLPPATRLTTLQRRAARRLSQIGFDYRASRLARWGGGERVADQEVREGGRPIRLYELLRRRRHVLLLPDATLPAELEPQRKHFAIAVSDGTRITLVRPDGYVAACGVRGVLSYLGTVFERAAVTGGRQRTAAAVTSS
jgi:2-polyprenyl-6-methoxyphenol hydroxylase-like FAD-dependent oxidoreductase